MRVRDLKHNPKNPRKITDAKLHQLGVSMQAHGDLSGVVFNRRTGNLVGGHQRSKQFNSDTEVKIVKTFDPPTNVGTVAVGYLIHKGERYSYREVDWDREKETAANIAANKNAGEFDLTLLTEQLEELSTSFSDIDLDTTMFDAEELTAVGIDLSGFDETESNEGTDTDYDHNADIDDEESVEEEIEEPAKLEGQVQLFNQDNLEVMRGIPDNTFDSIVTDPPYGWRFMGKAWDGEDIVARASDKGKGAHKPEDVWFIASDGRRRRKGCGVSSENNSAGAYDFSVNGNKAFEKFSYDWAKEAYRILKPGGYIIVFCGPRTYHRMASGVEDAGFEIRDQLQWLFGSGFPKSLDISKAIDKAAGAEREVTGTWKPTGTARIKGGQGAATSGRSEQMTRDGEIRTELPEYNKPATDDARKWEGYGTALKPANEPILLARKPISEKTVALNVLKWGTGGLNIGACRIGTEDSLNGGAYIDGGMRKRENYSANDKTAESSLTRLKKGIGEFQQPTGRFPANLILDPDAAQMLDEQTGELGKSAGGNSTNIGKNISFQTDYSDSAKRGKPCGFGDTGGASRFFYVAKSSKTEKNMHCRESEQSNNHPTVKPVTLMRYLCRLVTPANGLILDPFLGSGTTGVAALKEEFRFIGIERETDYFKICEKRLNYEHTKFEFIKTRVKKGLA